MPADTQGVEMLFPGVLPVLLFDILFFERGDRGEMGDEPNANVDLVSSAFRCVVHRQVGLDGHEIRDRRGFALVRIVACLLFDCDAAVTVSVEDFGHRLCVLGRDVDG